MEYKKFKEMSTCGFCFELYNGDKRSQRTLYCGHQFCNSCLDKKLVQNQSCPSCKNDKTDDKNTLILETKLDKINELQTSSLVVLAKRSNSEKLESEGYCSEHSYFQELRCMDCNSWICAMCGYLHHKHCRILLVKEAYKELHKQVSKRVCSELVTMETTCDSITDFLDVLHLERKDLIEEIREKEKELDDKEKRIEELESLKSEGGTFGEQLRELSTLIENYTDAEEFSEAMSKVNDLLDKGKMQLAELDSREILIPNSIENLKNLDRNVACVTQSHDGTSLKSRAYGIVEVKDGQIWISSFNPEKQKARLFPFKELLYKFGGSFKLPKTAFFKLSPEGGPEEDIEVVIETDGKSPRARNFILLCCALKMQTYKGMNIVFDNNYSSYDINPAPAPLVEGISGKDSRTSWREGFVLGTNELNSYFYIALKDNPKRSSSRIGVVISGLQKLKDCKAKKLQVKDCGIIINT